MTETITNISEALNASRSAGALEKVPAQADPGPEGGLGGQGGPGAGADPEKRDSAVDVQDNRGEQCAQVAQDTSGDQECDVTSASSPGPERAHRPGSQVPGAEGGGARGAKENCPPRHKPTQDCPGDRGAGGAKPTTTDGEPKEGEVSPPQPTPAARGPGGGGTGRGWGPPSQSYGDGRCLPYPAISGLDSPRTHQ